MAPEAAKNQTPTATSGQKRSSPRKTSSGKKTPPSKPSSGKKKIPAKSSSGKKNTPSKDSIGKKSSTSKEQSSDGNMLSKKKKEKVPSIAVPSNAEDSDIVKLDDGSQVMASEAQIVEVAESSQVYEADEPFRPIIRVDDAKVQAHKWLFYEQLEGHYSNIKTFNLMT